MSARTGQLSATRVSLVVVVAGMVVLLAALLAYEAYHAAQSQRRTAERALYEYASMAAAAFRDRYHDRWIADARRALGAATSGLAVSPFDPLVSLAVLRPPASEVLPCSTGTPDRARRYLRIDLRTGAVDAEPRDLPLAERAVLERAVRDATQRLPAPEEPYLLARASAANTASFVVVGVRFVRLGAPIGLYAFTACPTAFSQQVVREVLEGPSLLPPGIAGASGNRDLLSVQVHDAAGALLTWGDGLASVYRARVSLEDVGYSASVALREPALAHVAVGALETSRVPLLIGLLALTAALGAVALAQLRREHELARMRADFTSSVSHELRTPLTQILLYGETLLLDRARTREDRRAAAETIVQEAGRLMQMVENVLAFGRLRGRGNRPVEGDVALDAAIRSAVAILEPLATAAGMRLEVSGGAHVVRADPSMLRQVLLNLVDNAIKYGLPGQVIRLQVSRAADRVRLAVSDEGAGIALSDRERVWLPYVRLPHPHGRGGTGLGLAVVRELVDLMGGRTWIEDSPGSRGSRFIVELESAASARSAPAPRSDSLVAP
jgi:signal transduction histidine kinase